AIAVAPRLARGLVRDEATFPLGASAWADTQISLPPGFARFREAITGAPCAWAVPGAVSVGEVLARWPVALLVGERA
ncbi:MAG: hypothetical protein ACREQJ_14150, partial [Candidatus Binatia bacterium]